MITFAITVECHIHHQSQFPTIQTSDIPTTINIETMKDKKTTNMQKPSSIGGSEDQGISEVQ